MKTRAKRNKPSSTGRKKELTKQVLIQAATPAIRKASREAMETLGYVITVDSNWLVKKYQNGKTERLSELAITTPCDLKLD